MIRANLKKLIQFLLCFIVLLFNLNYDILHANMYSEERTESTYNIERNLKEVKEECIHPPDPKTLTREQELTARGKEYTYMEITAYTNYSDAMDGKGITASGEKTRAGICATTSKYPFGTILYIEGYGEVVVKDRGVESDNNLDIWMSSNAKAIGWGRKVRKVYIVKWGGK